MRSVTSAKSKLSLSSAILVFIGLLTLCPGRGLGQNKNHWERYQRRTLREVIRLHRDSDEFRDIQTEKKAMLLTGDDFASQVKLVYMGKQRSVAGTTKALVTAWKKTFKDIGLPQDEFNTEFLFKEGSEEHWLAVQNALVDSVQKELQTGDVLNAYVIWMGAIKSKSSWEWLFAMNEFVACPDAKQNCSF